MKNQANKGEYDVIRPSGEKVRSVVDGGDGVKSSALGLSFLILVVALNLIALILVAFNTGHILTAVNALAVAVGSYRLGVKLC